MRLLYEGETTKVTIDLKNEDVVKLAMSKDKANDIEEFYELIEVQKKSTDIMMSLKNLKWIWKISVLKWTLTGGKTRLILILKLVI